MFLMVFKGKQLFRYHHSCFLWEVEHKIGPLPDTWHINLNPNDYSHVPMNPNLTPDEFWGGLTEQYNGPWSDEEVRGFLRLIRRMLRIDPALRPSIESVEMDKWFDNVRDKKGEVIEPKVSADDYIY